ncbi:PAS domain S-box protein [Maribacter sp. 2304DJ31-5]|uniref:PAS domain-containing sensor histidine kinase n=1 Tax=Maribacter sp. 2304DJ31-5 TaxID=3386273 RepID=UPI0039BCBC57
MLKDPQIFSTSYLIKQLPTCAIFIDKKFKIIHASDKWINTFSQHKIDVYGKSLFRIFPDLDKKWKVVIEDCFKGQPKPLGLQKALEEHNNERWYEWTGTPWFDTDENVIGSIIQINDVTDQIKTEIKLKKTETLLNHQSEISKIGCWEYDVIHNKLKWCSMINTIHEVGHDYEPTVETAMQFYKEGHSRNAISMAFYEAVDKGVPWNLKLQIITAKGNEKWVIVAGKPIYEKGKMISILGTFQDVHEQMAADIKTKENEKLLKTLIDNLPLNVYIKDSESKKILANKSECDYLGINDSNKILGKSDFDLYPHEFAIISREEDLKVMETLEPILGKETVITKKDGTETTFLTSKIPLVDSEGTANGLVGISLDITNLKQKERELRNLINVTSLQNKKLINFAHIVSHNLRSHTANFSMLLSFLVDEKNEKEKAKIIGMLTSASDDLLETLDNLNEVVAISTNAIGEKEPVHLNKKINFVQRNLSNLLIKSRAKIINTITDDVYLQVIPEYLESILMNFLTNSIKYKHPDRDPIIRLSTKREDNYVILYIADNGLGIDLQKYGNKLFGMYKTFHTHGDARGMGLYITKNQVEAMDGKIKVESEVGKGSRFKIYFNEKN